MEQDQGTIPDDAPLPRIVHLLKWEDFDGYGFNLHGEKTKPGQYIGKVDKDSPAEAAGLKARDRIIEVNGTNIANENHKQVVQRIKTLPDETKLLVVDDRTEEYYKARGVVITGLMPNISYTKTPTKNTPPPAHPSPHSPQEDEDSDTGSHASSSLPSKTNSLRKPVASALEEEEERSSAGPSPSPPPSTATPSPTPLHLDTSSAKGSTTSLDLNMTAQEMRAKLASRKKFDPKNSKMDLRKKYDIIQTL